MLSTIAIGRTATEIVVAQAAGFFLWWLGIRLARRIAPPESITVHSVMEVLAAGQAARRLERRVGAVSVVIWISLVYPLMLALHKLNLSIDASANAVYDSRRHEWWLVPSVTMGAGIMYMFFRPVLRMFVRNSNDPRIQYLTTRDDVDHLKGARAWSFLYFMLSMPICWASWSNGIVIDDQGMRVRLAWHEQRHNYDEVRAVERLDEFIGNGKRSPGPCIRVTFDDQRPFVICDGITRIREPDADRIAEYIAERAGVPVQAVPTAETEGTSGKSTP